MQFYSLFDFMLSKSTFWIENAFICSQISSKPVLGVTCAAFISSAYQPSGLEAWKVHE